MGTESYIPKNDRVRHDNSRKRVSTFPQNNLVSVAMPSNTQLQDLKKSLLMSVCVSNLTAKTRWLMAIVRFQSPMTILNRIRFNAF